MIQKKINFIVVYVLAQDMMPIKSFLKGDSRYWLNNTVFL